MSEYIGPNPTEPVYLFKWLRVLNDMFIGEISKDGDELEDEGYNHDSIADTNNLRDKIETLKRTDPTQVDAGRFQAITNLKSIQVDGSSDRLQLPVTPNARPISVALFQQRSPGYEIRANTKYMDVYKP